MLELINSRNAGPGGKDFGNREKIKSFMDTPVFKKEYKKELIVLIGKLRDLGGSYSEIKDYLNENAQKTPNGKLWSSAYIYRFYNSNK